MSKIMQAALDPSCLMCLTPGGWWSPLRQGVIWPGSPRNFSTEPARWYDFIRFASNVPTADNFLFRMKFTVEQSMLGTTWYLFAGDVCSLVVNYSGNVYWYCAMGVMSGYSNITLVLLSMINTAGTYEITARITGNGVKLDGVRLNADGSVADTKSVTGSITSRVAATGSFTQSQFNGTIASIEMQNTTTGDRISYPPEAEWLRLITTNGNVLVGDRYFEAADKSVEARIDSRIDLRGKVSDYTAGVEFEALKFPDIYHKQELAGQGPALGQPAIASLCYARTAGNGDALVLSQEVAGARVQLVAPNQNLSGRHIAFGVVKVGVSSTWLSIYRDGERVISATVAGTPTGTAYSTYTNYAINSNLNGTYTNHFGKIYAAVLFNRALSAPEIAYLSK